MPKKRSSAAKARSAFNKTKARTQPLREAAIKKYKAKHGHKPRSFEDWVEVNKAWGRAYRAKKKY